MIVRPARPEDWRTWRDVRLRALADAPDAFGETVANAEKKPEAHWHSSVDARPNALRLFAEEGGAVVGMVVAIVGHEDADYRRGAIYAMWVAPEARGTGAGKQLVDTALRWLRSQAALEVELRVSDTADAARRLYLRCGFRDNGERSVVRDGSPVMASTLVQRLPPLIMGVVNVTPDSFSDGGAYLDPAAAIAHGEQLLADGADILDIGGEATNPRAQAVSADEELRRVLPVIEGLAALGVASADGVLTAAERGSATTTRLFAGAAHGSASTPGLFTGAAISIDTTKAAVARAAVAAGASIINDVSGGLFDPEMARAVAELDNVTYIAGHLRGRSLPEVFAAEGSVSWQTVAAELGDRLRELAPKRAWIDAGVGFGKGADPEGNVALLRHAGDIASTIRRPIVVGPSRKRFLRRLLAGRGQIASGVVQEVTTDVLDAASVLASLAAVRAGAHVVRVHNVALLRTALTAYNKEKA